MGNTVQLNTLGMEAGPLLESHLNKLFFIACYKQKTPQGFPFSKSEAYLGEVLH